ncbi:MAG: hypothetical protein ACE5JU_05310 [Candidatus Binatia bacterium]
MGVRVECYAGYRGEETPRRFSLAERDVEVVEVVDRWLTPDHRYFRLKGDDGGVYILRQDSVSGQWEMTMFNRGMGQEPC